MKGIEIMKGRSDHLSATNLDNWVKSENRERDWELKMRRVTFQWKPKQGAAASPTAAQLAESVAN